ncbi:hypothetical protein [Nitrosospira briensis]|uniref:hypothetical protein n=1 Tax=Nitrosospira briensis TaxID=35799 RepID=UPI0018D1ECB1|nr:hypothetical protein [Nitrosospira briensis]
MDFTYENIVQWEQANLMVDDVPVFDLATRPLRFVGLPNTQRGSLFSYFTISVPVEEIEVSEQGLAITQSKIKYAYKWNEITRASIVARIISNRGDSSHKKFARWRCQGSVFSSMFHLSGQISGKRCYSVPYLPVT